MLRFPTNIALSEVPVNDLPLIDDTDFKTRETAIAYNASGMDLVWNFVTSTGAMTQTAVTPTTGGSYDWTHQGDGLYSIEIPKSGGASINNDTVGFGWFSGFVTGVLPWKGPLIEFVLGGAITGGTPTTTECICTDLAGTVNDQHKEAYIKFLSGAAKDAPRKITAFDFATNKLTFDALPTTPSVGDVFVIMNG